MTRWLTDAEQLELGALALDALESGRVPVDADDYQGIATWIAATMASSSSEDLRRLARNGRSSLTTMAANALSTRGEQPWTHDEASRGEIEAAWARLRHTMIRGLG